MRVPPGRAGRLWLRARIQRATTAAVMLDQKLHVLRDEQGRFADRARAALVVWRDKHAEAQRLVLRAVVLGGRGALAVGQGPPADLTVSWAATVGVRHPVSAHLTLPDREQSPSAAAILAHDAVADATLAAVAYAVAARALRAIETELRVTALRVRSLRQHWLPRLTDALATVELELEEQERAETVRRRWARVR